MARRWLIVLALGATVLGAAVLRFWDLGANPGGLFTDEAAEALSAHRILTEPGFHPVFFTDGGGREALFAYLVTEEYDAAAPDEHGVRWNDPSVKHLWSVSQPILSARDADPGQEGG